MALGIMRLTLHALIVILALGLCPDRGVAQAVSDSTLSLKSSRTFWGPRTKILMGANEQELYSLGNFPSGAPAELLKTRSAEASQLYLRYQTKQSVSTLLYMVAGIGLIVGFAHEAQENETEAWVSLGISGVSIVSGLILKSSGKKDLQESVQIYNTTFEDRSE